MVTFSMPSDDVVETTKRTSGSRPSLPFAKRMHPTGISSPFSSSSARRLSTPQPSSTRKLSTSRDEMPSTSFNQNSFATSRNIFRASAMSDNSFATGFSPSLPNSTTRKVFAPDATPEPSRIHRESIAQATPRGMAARASTKDLFHMRIASPPPELTGEALSQKIPKEWNSKGSIYADQFLAHLCPPELDEEQRRQFFCILDLRRLKYAANEIFAKKDWKLNVINFAKEFEKSRSIILLRYGLYEFQNVKPSKDVLKRWRREHGLPDPEEDEDEPTPTRPTTSKKRKANDDDSLETPAVKGKRRATDKTGSVEPSVFTPSTNKNKRKASVSEEQPAKMQKPSPSSAKALFEQIANNKSASSGSTPAEKPATKLNLFAANRPASTATTTSSSLARSVFANLEPLHNPAHAAGTSSGTGANIFGHLSDASSAKNSGVEADAESESDSDQNDSQEADQSDSGPGVGAGDTETMGAQQLGSGTSTNGSTAAHATGPRASSSSAPGTRDSTPGRSLFDRVTKGSDGQPVRHEESMQPEHTSARDASERQTRADEIVHDEPAVADQTWNPSTTPIKFAPSSTNASTSSLLGKSGSNAADSTLTANSFAQSSTIFGTHKPEQAFAKVASTSAPTSGSSKVGGESDKENESSQPGQRVTAEDKSTPSQPAFMSSSIFGAKSAGIEIPKPVPNPFGATVAAAAASETDAKAAETDSSTLHKDQTSDASAAAASLDTSKPNAAPIGSLFGNKAPSTATSLFGSGQPTPAQQPTDLRTGSSADAVNSAAVTTTNVPKPIFNFATTTAATPASGMQPLFGAPKSPSHRGSTDNLFGSPMKQDDPSPAKKTVFGSKAGGDSTPLFNFGTNQQGAPVSNIFGAASSAPAQSSNTTKAFGSASSTTAVGSGSASAPGSFNFNFSGAPASNPFATTITQSGGPATSAAPSAGGLFAFGAGGSSAANSATSSSASKPFQFLSGTAPAPTTGSGPSLFGGPPAAAAAAAAAAGGGSTPSFNFSAGGAATQGTGSVFGSNQAVPAFNLQPPAGGSTTTGTNSPLNFGGAGGAGGSSLATTPAAGTPEPTTQSDVAKDGDANNVEDGEKHEQINLVDAVDEEESVLHQVRAKALKFVPAPEKPDDTEKTAKSKSPWVTQGVGQLRLLRNKKTNMVRLLLRAEPRGHVALNRALLPNISYKADDKYVKLTTSNDKGDGLETWMIQVKKKDSAEELAEALEKNKA